MSVESVINNLYSVIDDPKSNKLITNELKVVELGLFTRIVMFIAQPLCSLLGSDSYYHYRAAKVTKRIEEYYKENKNEIDQNEDLSLKIQDVYSKLRKKPLFPLRDDDRLLSSEKLPSSPKIHKLPENLEIRRSNRELIDEKVSKVYRELSTREGEFYIRERKKVERANGKRIHKRRTYKLFVKSDDGRVRRLMRFNSPKSLTFLADQAFVMTNQVIAKGGFSTVKLVYSLLEDQYYVKKPLDPSDMMSVNLLEHLCGKTGFFTRYYLRVPEQEKPQLIQPKFAFNLREVIEGNKLTLSKRVGVLKDLLEGLVALHNCSTTVNDKEGNSVKLRMSHCDIKPRNILLRPKSDFGVETVFIDISFGQAINEGAHTINYCPPEKIFSGGDIGKNEIIAFYNDYGQAGDMWSFGMTILTFLLGSITTTTTNAAGEVVDRESGLFDSLFAKHLFPKGENSHPSKDLKQEDVTGFIDGYADFIQGKINALPSSEEGKEVATLWNQARKMMSVVPVYRPTAAEVLNALNGI